MKYFLLISFSLLLFLSSCNKNEKVEIKPDLLNCFYKTKSYWVYIDSVNNSTDSVYVVDHDHFFREEYVSDHTSYDVEYYTFRTMSSTNSETGYYEIVSSSLTKYSSITWNPTIIYRDYNNTNDGDAGNGYIFERLDSAFIYNQYYYKVLKIEVPEDGNEDGNKSIYFSNSDYGFLRHDIYSDSILISSKIMMRKRIRR